MEECPTEPILHYFKARFHSSRGRSGHGIVHTLANARDVRMRTISTTLDNHTLWSTLYKHCLLNRDTNDRSEILLGAIQIMRTHFDSFSNAFRDSSP